MVTERVSTLYKLLIKGASRKDLRQIAAKWGVSDRQIERYIAAATAEIEKRAEYRRNYEMGKTLARLDDLYMECERSGDVRGRLGVIKQISDIIGLNSAIKQEISGSLTTSQEWIDLRGTIIKVLSDYPEARAAILAAIAPKEKEE